MTDIIEQAHLAKRASKQLKNTTLETRNNILSSFASKLLTNMETILQANKIDVNDANIPSQMIDRLRLTKKRIKAMAEGIENLVALDDPIHQIQEEKDLASGVHLQKVTVPLGVVGIIFEARPNVTADCIALCIKSGNACVLKGGKEAYRTSLAIVTLAKACLTENHISSDVVMLAEKISHEETYRFMACREYVDVLIPRGSARLIQSVVEHAKVPVIETGAGICHVFVDQTADQKMALDIIINAKCQRPSVCNSIETVLLDTHIAASILPFLKENLLRHNVQIFADEKTRLLDQSLQSTEENSFDTEYNDLKINLKIVENIEEAIDHIERHGTHHSDCIVSENMNNVNKFFAEVDSACVYHNASTRFSDGFEFGLGAEIGISTQKLHARGPMGLSALTSYTYRLFGKGEIRK